MRHDSRDVLQHAHLLEINGVRSRDTNPGPLRADTNSWLCVQWSQAWQLDVQLWLWSQWEHRWQHKSILGKRRQFGWLWLCNSLPKPENGQACVADRCWNVPRKYCVFERELAELQYHKSTRWHHLSLLSSRVSFAERQVVGFPDQHETQLSIGNRESEIGQRKLHMQRPMLQKIQGLSRILLRGIQLWIWGSATVRFPSEPIVKIVKWMPKQQSHWTLQPRCSSQKLNG